MHVSPTRKKNRGAAKPQPRRLSVLTRPKCSMDPSRIKSCGRIRSSQRCRDLRLRLSGFHRLDCFCGHRSCVAGPPGLSPAGDRPRRVLGSNTSRQIPQNAPELPLIQIPIRNHSLHHEATVRRQIREEFPVPKAIASLLDRENPFQSPFRIIKPWMI